MELTLAAKAHCCRRPRASARMGRGACPLPAMVDPRALGTRGGCSRLPCEHGDRRGRLDLKPLIPIVAIIAFAAIKIVRIAVNRPVSPPPDVTARVEELERVVQSLQQELAETQERLDFAERLLGKAREERRIGS